MDEVTLFGEKPNPCPHGHKGHHRVLDGWLSSFISTKHGWSWEDAHDFWRRRYTIVEVWYQRGQDDTPTVPLLEKFRLDGICFNCVHSPWKPCCLTVSDYCCDHHERPRNLGFELCPPDTLAFKCARDPVSSFGIPIEVLSFLLDKLTLAEVLPMCLVSRLFKVIIGERFTKFVVQCAHLQLNCKMQDWKALCEREGMDPALFDTRRGNRYTHYLVRPPNRFVGREHPYLRVSSKQV